MFGVDGLNEVLSSKVRARCWSVLMLVVAVDVCVAKARGVLPGEDDGNSSFQSARPHCRSKSSSQSESFTKQCRANETTQSEVKPHSPFNAEKST